MAGILTRKQLDQAECDDCDDPDYELYLHGRCHPSAGTRASYDKRTGVLTISCRQCRRFIADLKIADE